MLALRPKSTRRFLVALSVDLNVDPSNWRWVHCLTVPTLNTLQFSQRPYKWIRYAIGVVVGAEVDLSSSSDSLNVVDYNAGLPAESAFLYYHTNEEKRRMFPADPNIGRTNVTDSNNIATSRRVQFREDVIERDRVLAGLEVMFSNAVHLLAHNKGDSVCYYYSQSLLAHHRNGGSTFRLILSVAALGMTLCGTLTMFGTAFF